MNKTGYLGIFAITTAMLGAIGLSSCSHDDYYYNEDRVEQNVNKTYAAAFEKVFGKVGSNVDWGFSSKNAGARAFTRAEGEAFPTTIDFPGDCDKDIFDLDPNVPSYDDYCKSIATSQWNIPTEFGYGVVYIDNQWDDQRVVHINGGTESQRSKLYIKEGEYSFTSENFYLGKYVDLVLLEGATVTFDNAVALNAIFDIYIAPGAELIANGADGLKANSGMHVYNHGTITCSKFEANTNSVLYNNGTVNAPNGTVSAESNDLKEGDVQSIIVNNHEIECKDVVVNGGAVLNIFEWKVNGTTTINSPNSGWVNRGHWTTQNYAYVAGSENVINSCFLEVTYDFDMNVSSLSATGAKAFKMNSGGSVVTTNFYGGRDLSDGVVKGGPFRINMAENALFKVTNKATLESGRGPMSEGEVGFGFFGPSEGGYAVFQAKDIVRDPYLESINSHGAVTYGGNLYVSAETHFAQGYDSDGSGTYDPRPFIFEQGGFSIADNIFAGGFKSGKPDINIPKTGCSPGFQGETALYRVIAEDLSANDASDFDFNDVVFDVVKAENGRTTLKLICAGGILPLRVRGENEAEGVEVHSLFGETTPNAQGYYKMYNTGAGPNVGPAIFTVEGEYTTPEQIKNIIIEVKKINKWMALPAKRGEAACKILVDDTFIPVPERKNIANENLRFTNYVNGSFQDEDGFWWK